MDNQKKIRIKNEKTKEYVDKLMKSGRYTTFNDLANEVFDVGALDIYMRTFKAKEYLNEHKEKASSEATQVIEKLNAVLSATDDIMVNLEIVKALEQIRYTIWKTEQEGGTIAVEEVDNGLLLDMPKALQEIEDEMLKRRK